MVAVCMNWEDITFLKLSVLPKVTKENSIMVASGRGITGVISGQRIASYTKKNDVIVSTCMSTTRFRV
jgi:hypothetical protein